MLVRAAREVHCAPATCAPSTARTQHASAQRWPRLSPPHARLTQGVHALRSVLPLTGFLFGCVCYRELLMDINDHKGDAAAGIATVPVILGGARALTIAAGCLLAGAVAGVRGIARAKAIPGIAAAAGMQPGVAQAALQLLLLAGMLPALRDVHRMRRSQLDREAVDAAIAGSFQPIACGMLLLSLL